jgi:hypothetical protein
MKLRYLALAATIAVFTSCSSARKAQTTTDDVYYSDGTEDDSQSGGGGYVTSSDDRMAATTYGAANNYNDYAYGYTPFDTYIDPYWGAGFGMSPWYSPYSMFSVGFGYGAFYSPFYNPFFYYGAPSYYGGFYYPYYPGFGYYSKTVVTSSTSLYTGAAARINVLAYNTRHYNNVNTTVPSTGVTSIPRATTVSGRAPSTLAAGSPSGRLQPANNRLLTSANQGAVRQGSVRPANSRTFQQNQQTRSYQPAYRPASNNATFGRPVGGGFGGGGGARMGGGGFSRGGH